MANVYITSLTPDLHRARAQARNFLLCLYATRQILHNFYTLITQPNLLTLFIFSSSTQVSSSHSTSASQVPGKLAAKISLGARMQWVGATNFAVVHVIISMARLRALPTLATGDVTHVISRTRLPLFALACVEKDRGGWGRGYSLIFMRISISMQCTILRLISVVQTVHMCTCKEYVSQKDK